MIPQCCSDCLDTPCVSMAEVIKASAPVTSSQGQVTQENNVELTAINEEFNQCIQQLKDAVKVRVLKAQKSSLFIVNLECIIVAGLYFCNIEAIIPT